MTKLHPDDYVVLRRITGLPFSVLPEDLPPKPIPQRERQYEVAIEDCLDALTGS